MQIIIPGWKSPDWKQEQQCPACGAVLLLERSDLFYRKRDDYYNPCSVVCFECCSCNKEAEHTEYYAGNVEDAENQLKQAWGDLPYKGRTGWSAGE